MTSHPDERAAAMVETSEEITEHHTGTTPAPTARQRPAGGRISSWMTAEEPNGMHRCEAHFVEPVRAWDGLYAAKWTWAQNSPQEAAAGLLPWLRHQRVDIPDDLATFAEKASEPRQPEESVQP